MKNQVDIAGVPINNLTYDGVLRHVDQFIKDDRKIYIVTANPEMILNASRDEFFLDILSEAALITPDGTGVLWAANYLSTPLPKRSISRYFQLYKSLFSILFYPKSIKNPLKERVTGSDLFKEIINKSQDKKWRIFLLGASNGVAKNVISKFSKIYPKAKFVGYFAGSPHKKDEDEICEQINKVKPNILFVAYGSPQQELWIHHNLFKLNTVNVAMGVGGTFDFYAGKLKRAPKWMQKIGLEWLWRLTYEPKRIGRIWNATMRFPKLIAKEKIKNNSAQ